MQQFSLKKMLAEKKTNLHYMPEAAVHLSSEAPGLRHVFSYFSSYFAVFRMWAELWACFCFTTQPLQNNSKINEK